MKPIGIEIVITGKLWLLISYNYLGLIAKR